MVRCDRFADSTIAYQGYGKGLPLTICQLHRVALGDFTPDLTLILDLPVTRGSPAQRCAQLPPTGLSDSTSRSTSACVRPFVGIATAEPERCALIDAAGAPDAVHRAILDAVARRLRVVLGGCLSNRCSR